MPGNDLITKTTSTVALWHCDVFYLPFTIKHCLLKSKELQQLSGKDPPKDWNFLCHAGAVNFLWGVRTPKPPWKPWYYNDGFHDFSSDWFHVFIPKKIGIMLCLVSTNGFFCLAPQPLGEEMDARLECLEFTSLAFFSPPSLEGFHRDPHGKAHHFRDLWKEFYLNMFESRPHCMMTWFFHTSCLCHF